MTYENRHAQLYRITCSVNNWVYWGMVYTPNKTYLDRFEEHKIGKGGKRLYEGMCKFGIENFFIELIESGPFEYISKRENEESKNTLFAKNLGWNGNAGNAIYNDKETIKLIVSKRMVNEDTRILKFKETYKKLDQKPIQAKRNNTISNKSKEDIKNWRTGIAANVKGQTKETNERIKRQSETLKLKWENPTSEMLEGVRKSSDWKKGKNKENWDVMKKHSEFMKNKVRGKNNPMFKHYYITPLGKFETWGDANIAHFARTKNTIRNLCKNPETLISKRLAFRANLADEWVGQKAKDAGFGLEYV